MKVASDEIQVEAAGGQEKEVPREASGDKQVLESEVDTPKKLPTATKMVLLIVNIFLLALGNGGPLLTRLYFIQGGTRIWFTSFILTAGWPIMLILLFISYFHRRSATPERTKVILIGPRLFGAAVLVGVLIGLDNFMYSYGVSSLPVSTASLIMSTQLMFNAMFSFLLVKERFSPFSINSVFLLTLGALVLGLHASPDRPRNESRTRYLLSFFMTLGAAALYGIVLPLLQLAYKKSENQNTYTHVIEVQTVMSISATIFSAIGMIVNNDFQAIAREITVFGLGNVKYIIVVVSGAIIWQFFYLGLMGVVCCSSSLLAGVIDTAILPSIQILAVIFFHENFNAEKGISLALSLWGLGSYFYGEKLKLKRQRENLV